MDGRIDLPVNIGQMATSWLLVHLNRHFDTANTQET